MRRAIAIAAAALLAAGCATSPEGAAPADAFFARVAALCGQAFEGRIVSPAVAADADFAGERLVMHVRDCDGDAVRIPFQVGEDRSRTWLLTRSGGALTLKHDHRHRDGSPDALTRYGGTTERPGSAERQEFPADPESRALFERENIPQSAANIWALEIVPGRTFAYELRRPGRFFRVEFDLARPVPLPPPAWGAAPAGR